jgi:hypothetical protein
MKPEELEEIRHKNKLEEIEAELKAKLEVERRHHDNELERQRIRGAEIRKNIMRREGY